MLSPPGEPEALPAAPWLALPPGDGLVVASAPLLLVGAAVALGLGVPDDGVGVGVEAGQVRPGTHDGTVGVGLERMGRHEVGSGSGGSVGSPSRPAALACTGWTTANVSTAPQAAAAVVINAPLAAPSAKRRHPVGVRRFMSRG